MAKKHTRGRSARGGKIGQGPWPRESRDPRDSSNPRDPRRWVLVEKGEKAEKAEKAKKADLG